MAGFDVPAIGLDRVSHALKGEKGNPSWQYNAQMPFRAMDSDRVQSRVQVIQEKVGVFKISQDPQIRHNTDYQQKLSLAGMLNPSQTQPHQVVNQRSRQYQQTARNAPTHVKHIAGH